MKLSVITENISAGQKTEKDLGLAFAASCSLCLEGHDKRTHTGCTLCINMAALYACLQILLQQASLPVAPQLKDGISGQRRVSR